MNQSRSRYFGTVPAKKMAFFAVLAHWHVVSILVPIHPMIYVLWFS